MRLKEIHGVYGDDVCDHDHQCSCTSSSDTSGIGVGGGGSGGAGNGGGGVFDDGMSNAWFPGETGSVDMYESRDGDRNGKRRSSASKVGGERGLCIDVMMGEEWSRVSFILILFRRKGGGRMEGYPHPHTDVLSAPVERTYAPAAPRGAGVGERGERREGTRFAGVGLGLSGPPSSPASTAAGSGLYRIHLRRPSSNLRRKRRRHVCG